MLTTSHDFATFIKNGLQTKKICHFVLAGAVVSGQIEEEPTPETISLRNVTIYSGHSVVQTDFLFVPLAHILTWGFGKLVQRK